MPSLLAIGGQPIHLDPLARLPEPLPYMKQRFRRIRVNVPAGNEDGHRDGASVDLIITRLVSSWTVLTLKLHLLMMHASF